MKCSVVDWELVMACRNCESNRIMSISGKCSDLFNAEFKGKEHSGYVTREVGIGGGDYITFDFCLECGCIQDQFPKEDH